MRSQYGLVRNCKYDGCRPAAGSGLDLDSVPFGLVGALAQIDDLEPAVAQHRAPLAMEAGGIRSAKIGRLRRASRRHPVRRKSYSTKWETPPGKFAHGRIGRGGLAASGPPKRQV